MAPMYQRKKKQSDDHLIPMINIVFLILIFFMVAGQIQRSLPEGIVLPQGKTGQQADQERIELAIDTAGNLLMNNKVLTEAGFKQALLSAKNQLWVLLADKDVTAKQLHKVMLQIQDAGVGKLKLMTQIESTAS